MKKVNILFSILTILCLFIACSSDDDAGTAPTLSNEISVLRK